MTALLAILLYLSAIFSPGTYTTTQIGNIINERQPEIQSIQNDPVLYQQIQDNYGDLVNQVIVIDIQVLD